MNSKPLPDNGEPVEQIVLNFSSLYFDLIFTLSLLSVSMYLALTPNNVTFSSFAILNSRSFLLYIGKPSNNNKDALDDKALTSQFHIIHPQVVK